MAEGKSTAEASGCDEDSGLGDCVVCRDVWKIPVPAEILHGEKRLLVCLNCLLTERWLQHKVQTRPQIEVKASRLLRQCKTCIAESSGHPWVNWRFCLKCCQHVCGSSHKGHPCKAPKLVSLTLRCSWW